MNPVTKFLADIFKHLSQAQNICYSWALIAAICNSNPNKIYVEGSSSENEYLVIMNRITICHLVSAKIDKDTKFHANISFRYIVDICYLQNHHFKVADKFFCHKHLKRSKSVSYLRHTNVIMILKVTIPMKLSSSKIYQEEFSRKEWLLLFLVRLSMK